jgi:hypothetical protein
LTCWYFASVLVNLWQYKQKNDASFAVDMFLASAE